MDINFPTIICITLGGILKALGKLEYYGGAVITITLFNKFLGEKCESTSLVMVLVALTVMYKGLLVIDHFMELKTANKPLRLLMRTYFIFFPSIIIITALI